MAQDLYTELLQVPPGPRPPHHYALLGLHPFEKDLQRIHVALMAQAGKLKARAPDPNPVRANRVQEMLNEVNRAGAVLSSPESKRLYDLQLALKLGIEASCPSCGERWVKGAAVCRRCGLDAATGKRPDTPPEPPQAPDLSGPAQGAFPPEYEPVQGDHWQPGVISHIRVLCANPRQRHAFGEFRIGDFFARHGEMRKCALCGAEVRFRAFWSGIEYIDRFARQKLGQQPGGEPRPAAGAVPPPSSQDVPPPAEREVVEVGRWTVEFTRAHRIALAAVVILAAFLAGWGVRRALRAAPPEGLTTVEDQAKPSARESRLRRMDELRHAAEAALKAGELDEARRKCSELQRALGKARFEDADLFVCDEADAATVQRRDRIVQHYENLSAKLREEPSGGSRIGP